MIDAVQVAGVLGGSDVLKQEVRSTRDLLQLVDRGLPKTSLKLIVERVLPHHQVREFLRLVIPEATYQRSGPLSRLYSERTERLARVVALAEQVWQNPDQAHRWLNTAHPELSDRTPLEFSISELGAREVELLLNRLLYGLPV